MSMDELIPVILAFVFGGLIWRTTTGLVRNFLSVTTILAVGLAATLVSGELYKSWIYLPIDVSEAAAGFAGVFALGIFARRRRVRSTSSKSARVSPWALLGRTSQGVR